MIQVGLISYAYLLVCFTLLLYLVSWLVVLSG